MLSVERSWKKRASSCGKRKGSLGASCSAQKKPRWGSLTRARQEISNSQGCSFASGERGQAHVRDRSPTKRRCHEHCWQSSWKHMQQPQVCASPASNPLAANPTFQLRHIAFSLWSALTQTSTLRLLPVLPVQYASNPAAAIRVLPQP